MDEDIKARVLKLLDFVESGGQYVAAEAPEVAREIVMWTFFGNAISCCGLAVAISASIAGIVFVLRSKCETKDAVIGCRVIAGVLGYAVLLMSITACQCGWKAAKTYIAPRLVVLEHIGKAVKP